MVRMVVHAELVGDDSRDPFTGPHLAEEPERLRAPRQQVRQFGSLLRAQAGHPPRRRLGAQRVGASFAPSLEPLAHRALTHPQRRRYRLPRPALLVQLQRPQPTPLAPIPRRALLLRRHAPERTRLARRFTTLRRDQ